jgi:hypothetical protein
LELHLLYLDLVGEFEYLESSRGGAKKFPVVGMIVGHSDQVPEVSGRQSNPEIVERAELT